jgi:hypothetical protein
MSDDLKNFELKKCNKYSVWFNTPEGLNKFTEFMLRNDIKGLGFESSKKNTDYIGFFTDEEIEKISKYFVK